MQQPWYCVVVQINWLGKNCLGQSLDRSEENSKLLSTMVEERKLIEKGKGVLDYTWRKLQIEWLWET
jgi:hypothetical protein